MLGKKCKSSPEDAWRLNVTATTNLLNALDRAANAPRLIFISSGMVYNARKIRPPFIENDPVSAHCLYTYSKLRIEHLLHLAAKRKTFSSLILRPFTVYGEGALSGDRGHLFGHWLELGRQGKQITIFGDGNQVVDPVPVERVAQACASYLSLHSPPQLMTVNITSGNRLTIRQLADLFVESGVAPCISTEPGTMADSRRGWGSAERLEALIGQKLSRDPAREVAAFLGCLNRGSA